MKAKVVKTKREKLLTHISLMPVAGVEADIINKYFFIKIHS